MYMFRADCTPGRRRPARLSLLLLVLFPLAGAGQERAVVSSEITVSSGEASLVLQFFDGGRLAISLRGDEVLVDGESVGDFQRGDALDAEWRSLLGRVVAMDNGALTRTLLDWSPTASLEGNAARMAGRLDEALESGLQTTSRTSLSPAGGPGAGIQRELDGLFSRPELLPLLAEAVEGLDLAGLEFRIGEGPLRIADGETFEGPLLVVDGDVEVRGRLEGDVVVVGGSLRIIEGGEITGDVRLADSRLSRDGGNIRGEVTTVTAREAVVTPDGDRLRNQLRDEIRDELRREFGRSAPGRSSSFVRSFGQGISGLVQNVMGVLILATLGWILIHFAGPRVETIATVVRSSPARAGVVGLAAAFLVLPVWILGIVGLAISILGILAIPFWIVLFPLAVSLAALTGGIAAATVLGEWITNRRIQGLERLRPSNPFHTVLVGVTLLMLAFMGANVLKMAGPVTGVLQGLLTALGVLSFITATFVGLGAVLLTRGGARAPGAQPRWAGGFDDDWDEDSFEEQGTRSRWQARWEAERARWKRDEPAADDWSGRREAPPEPEPAAEKSRPAPPVPPSGAPAGEGRSEAGDPGGGAPHHPASPDLTEPGDLGAARNSRDWNVAGNPGEPGDAVGSDEPSGPGGGA
jgi:hypothetical protein